MTTKPNKITDRSARKLSSILAAVISWLLPTLILIVTIESSFGASATWLGDFDGDWNFRDIIKGFTNWTNNDIPNGPSDTATFATSNITDVFLSANTEVNGIVFNPSASPFTISVNSNLTLTISGVGITNNSGITQNFVTESFGAINFTNSATAGQLTVFNNNGADISGELGGATRFFDSSTAGNATLIANAGSGGSGGTIEFHDTSTAGNATITNNGADFLNNTDNHFSGATRFFDSSNAGNATLIADASPGGGSGGTIDFFDTSTASNATLIANAALIDFHDTSSAGNAMLTVNGSASAISNTGFIHFLDSSTAGNATLIANGGSPGGGNGLILFFNTSTASNATLIANGGSGGGFPGFIQFFDSSTGGTARVEVFGNGGLDISGHAAPGVTIGSIEGNGDVFLGANNLTVGSNNLSTPFSGGIHDGGPSGGTGGSLTKVGTGTLSLSGRNSYTGTTFVNEGTLTLVGNASNQNQVINGPLIIGDDVGAANTAILIDSGDRGTINNVPVTVNSDGRFEVDVGTINGGEQILAPVVINRGNVNVTTALRFNSLQMIGGLISGDGRISDNPDNPTPDLLTATSDASGDAARISTNVVLEHASEVLTVNDGPGSTDLLISGVIFSGDTIPVAGITKEGAGTLVLSGANTYTGTTFVNEGTLTLVGNASNQNQVINGPLIIGDDVGAANTAILIDSGDRGTINNVPVTVNSDGRFEVDVGTINGGEQIGPLVINRGNVSVTTSLRFNTLQMIGGSISGVGQIALDGPLTATSDASGNAARISSNVDLLTASRVLTINDGPGSADLLISGVIFPGSPAPSTVGITKEGTGTLVLSGANTYTGPTMVNAGALLVDGSLAFDSAVTVNTGATLGGTGTATGAVTIADGGILAPGNSPGTLTLGALSLGNASLLNYDLGTPGVIGSQVNDLTNVNGNLTLDGILNTTALGGFGPGAYRLFNYGGALTNNTLNIGTVPPGFLPSNFTVITGLPNEVDLLVLAGQPPPTQFWDGPNTRPNGVIDGGTGNWDNSITNWTNASGNNNSNWQNDVAVFARTAGIVTVTQPIFFAGMEFMIGGYQIDQGVEGSLNLIGSPFITTDTGVTTINATLNGAGGITKEGPGTLILTGANTYTGGTTISTGTLQLGNGGTSGSIVGDVVNNGTFAINRSDMFTFGGVISGTGAFQQLGTGTTVLTGQNTYAGVTAVNGGTLAAGAVNTLPSQTALTVATGATFDLNNFSQSIGSLAGAGSVTLGAATLTTGNDNTSTDFSGVISGGGSLTKVGTGTLTLAGLNTYTGATTVNRGSLIVNRSISSAQTSVNAGGLLGGGPAIAEPGRGIIGGNLTNSGIVSPGNSPGTTGTLTVNGNYIQTAPNPQLGLQGGTLRIEIAGLGPGAHDLLAVNGTANVSGTLQLIPLNNFQFPPGGQLTFLTANGGVHGTFNPIQNPFVISGTMVAVQIVSNPNSVGLETTPISPQQSAAVFSTSVAVANVQTTNLERRMERIRAGSRGFSREDFTINSGVHEFSMGLAGPTGPEGKSGPSVMQPTPDNRWGVFVTGLGEFTDVDSTNVARGYYLSTGGLTFGADYRVSPNFAIGLIGGYAHTNADLGDNDNLDVNGGTVGVYATGWSGGFYVDTAVTGGFNGYDTHRSELLRTVSGNTDGRDFNALVAAGYDWKSGGLTIGPVASFQYTYVEFDEFTEHGSLVPLSFPDQNTDSSRTALGAKASYDWHVGHVLVRPEIRASWQHEFGATEYSIVANFANGTGNNFTVNGPAIGRDSLLLGAGAAVLLNDRVTVYAYYDGELARTNYSSNGVSGGLRITF